MKKRRAADMAQAFGAVSDIQIFEEILACNIKDVVADLCLADPDILIAYANHQLHGNINEIVMSSAELIFKDKTLSYAHAADVSSEWGQPPRVVLGMEFVHGVVSVFFKLVLGEQYVGVHIDRMLLEGDLSRRDFDTTSFSDALTSARLRPLPPHFRPSFRPPNAIQH